MAMTKNDTVPAAAQDDTLTAAANIPATDAFIPSGAPDQVTEFDPEHPAVDNNPRANTTVEQNKIDFNDPTLDGAEAVRRNLEAQKPAAVKTEPKA